MYHVPYVGKVSPPIYMSNMHIHLLRVGWRNLVRVSLIFAIIVSFMLFTVFQLTESVGPVLFSAEYLICRHVQTDRQTDRQTDGRIHGRINLGGAG